jgi:hypothetical protein
MPPEIRARCGCLVLTADLLGYARYVRTPLVAVAVLLISTATFADEADRNGAEAEELFQNGKAALARQDYARACQYFQDSQKLDPGLGTLINLAICHELDGKLATAWTEFKTVEEQAALQKPPQFDRIRTAREHSDAIYPRLARIRILVLPSVQVAGLTVAVDGREMLPALWTGGVPVDSGPHAIEATAPGKTPFQASLILQDGVANTVQVLALRDAPKVLPAMPSPPPIDARTLTAPKSDPRTQRVAGEITMFVGGAALLAGATFGVLALVKRGAANLCSPSAPCVSADPAKDSTLGAARDGYQGANLAANLANLLIPTGLIAGGIGGYLFFTANQQRSVSLTAIALPGRAALSASGRF